MSRQSAGLLAKQVGNTFEELLELQCRQRGIGFKKLPDGCRRAYINGQLRLIPTRTPFDFILCKAGKAATVDAKTVQGQRFTFSQCDPKQVEALDDMGQHLPSGYVIWFRQSDRVVFFNHSILSSLRMRMALTDQEGLYLGQVDFFNPEKILNLPVKSQTQGSLL